MTTSIKQNTQRHCYYCINHTKEVDYKDVQTLKRFISSFLKIGARKRTGLCSKHQRQAARAIKQARVAGLMAFVPR